MGSAKIELLSKGILNKVENFGRDVVNSIVTTESKDFLYSRPIKLDYLKTYIKQMQEDGGFKTEFESLGVPTRQLQSWDYATRPENIPKHRYPTAEDNLICYDKTRVQLVKEPGKPYSDFIMANWIDSYAEKKRYIATQGPMESTATDFYRMIWQYNVHEIVMLANMHDVEKGKTVVYYPETTATYGEIEVELKRKIEYPGVLVRIYAMKRFGMIRVLVHHHYLGWPDKGVPKDSKSLLELMKVYRGSDAYTRAWPVVVHCAGGVGRTGTFILADSMFDMAQNEDHVDFLKHLWVMRNQRISMVETPEQYELAHRVILDAYEEGIFNNE